MSESVKHLLGPWTPWTADGWSGTGGAWIKGANGRAFAFVDGEEPDNSDAAAKVRFVIAAPDLLMVLKKHEHRLSERATCGPRAKPTVAELNEMLDDFRAAIAKAEGRS